MVPTPEGAFGVFSGTRFFTIRICFRGDSTPSRASAALASEVRRYTSNGVSVLYQRETVNTPRGLRCSRNVFQASTV